MQNSASEKPWLPGDATGFQSQAQDYLERVIDLPQILNLNRPGLYPVRVEGARYAARGILEGDILIVDTAGMPGLGKMAVAFHQGEIILAMLVKVREGMKKEAGEEGSGWALQREPGDIPLTLGGATELWGVVTSLVRQHV